MQQDPPLAPPSMPSSAYGVLAALTLGVMGMIGPSGRADETAPGAQDEAAEVPAATPTTPLEDGGLIDFDQLDGELRQIVERILRSDATAAGVTIDRGNRRSNEPRSPSAAVRIGIVQVRIAALRQQAERNLRGIVLLERALTGDRKAEPTGTEAPFRLAATVGRAIDATVEKLRGDLTTARQELAELQLIRRALEAELSHARTEIGARRDRPPGLAEAWQNGAASSPTPDVAGRAADAARGLKVELDRTRSELSGLAQERSRLTSAYQQCRQQIALLETEHTRLLAQVSDATKTAHSCAARLARANARLADMLEQIERLEAALAAGRGQGSTLPAGLPSPRR